MKINQLKALVAISRTGGIRAAARSIGVSQPALTKTIKELERVSGVEILTRTNRGAELTEAGHLLLPRARAALRELEYAAMEMRRLAGAELTRVSMAVSPVLGENIVPKAMNGFRRKFPNAEVTIYEGFSEQSNKLVIEGAIDFGLLSILESHGAAKVGIEPWFQLDHKVVGREGHPLGRHASLDELLEQEWLVTNRYAGGQFSMLGEICRVNERSLPKRLTEVPSLSLIRAIILQSDAVVLAPVWQDQKADGVAVIECEEIKEQKRNFGLIRNVDSPISSTASVMIQELKKHCRALQLPV